MADSDHQEHEARFWRKFLRLTRGRIPVVRALTIIRDEETHDDFKDVLGHVVQSIEKGATVSEAIAEHPALFSTCVVELIRSAEKTGAWDDILREIHEGLSDGTFE